VRNRVVFFQVKRKKVRNYVTPMNTGQSLNDHIHKGQKLQRNIVSVIINFRFLRFVFSADIKQMFRQILVYPPDRNYQCILWRADSIQQYQLNTVTYGLVTSQYQATSVS